ncbi:sodium-independent anion transporter [Solemya velum gill symbiont]|nr:sodium-independent anion transporter [Solemya velum gill symbiont]
MFTITPAQIGSIKDDTLSGLTVALALVPEAVAFAFVAHVSPEVGLWAAVIVGFLAAAIGGRPGMISGATGALAVIMAGLVIQHGVDYLCPAVILMGLIQISVGVLRLGKYMRIVPYPVMLGFVNGLAVVIFLAQLQQFFDIDPVTGEKTLLETPILMATLGVVLMTLAIIHFLPKFTMAVPAALVAIVSTTLLTLFATQVGFDFGIKTVGDVAPIGGLPTLPDFSQTMGSWDQIVDTFMIIFPYSFAFAAIGLVESLLTLGVIDEMTGTRGCGNKECVGQGIANIVAGSAGTMGGCAMIGQSMININSGGFGRLSGIMAAVSLALFILFGSSLIEVIPVAALVGVMFIVVLATFEWSSFRILRKVPKHDAFVLIVVSVITVITDNLALAVGIGVIISALVFSWTSAIRVVADISVNEEGAKIYVINGPLFFGSAKVFSDLFTPDDDPDEVIVDFINSRVVDHSAVEAIDSLAERYTKRGKNLHLRHLSVDCTNLLNKAGDLVEVNYEEDPNYKVADDKLA